MFCRVKAEMFVSSVNPLAVERVKAGHTLQFFDTVSVH